jgi:hypothetical protein
MDRYTGITTVAFLGIASRVALSIFKCAMTNSGGVGPRLRPFATQQCC